MNQKWTNFIWKWTYFNAQFFIFTQQKSFYCNKSYIFLSCDVKQKWIHTFQAFVFSFISTKWNEKFVWTKKSDRSRKLKIEGSLYANLYRLFYSTHVEQLSRQIFFQKIIFVWGVVKMAESNSHLFVDYKRFAHWPQGF